MLDRKVTHESWRAAGLAAPRTFIVVALAMTTTSSVVLFPPMALVPAALSLFFGVLLLLTTPLVLYLWYRSDPVFMQKRPLLERVQDQERVSSAADRKVTELERAREAIRQTFEKDKHRIDAERADLPSALKRDQDRVRESFRKKVFLPLEGEQKRSYQREQDEVRAALGNVQAQYIARMMAQPIQDATIDGVGASMKSRLVAAGIATARDVSPAAVASVSGFGEARVMSVVAWRERLQQDAQRTMPQTLSAADQQAITAGHAAERADIERRWRTAETDQTNKLQERADWYAARPAGLDAELQNATIAYQTNAKNNEDAIQSAVLAQNGQAARLGAARVTLVPFQDVTYRRYCRTVLLGARGTRRDAAAVLDRCNALIVDIESNIDFALHDGESTRTVYENALSLRTEALALLADSESPWAAALARSVGQRARDELIDVQGMLPGSDVKTLSTRAR